VLRPRSAVWLCALCLLGVSCRRATPSPSIEAAPSALPTPAPLAPSASVRAASDAHVGRTLPPLVANWVEPLPLADGNLAYVMPPIGARGPRPLIVGVHGAGDRPDWACGGWRLGESEYAFIVCPQGLKMDPLRFAWDSPRTITRRVESALRAVRERFGAYIADGPVLYVGFSQGATLAGPVLLAEPNRFPAVALAEGGYGLLRDPAFLRRLRENGTSRVMIVCGSAACFQTASSVAPNLARAGLELLTAGDAHAGHNLNQPMQQALRARWPAFVDGLPNWRDFPAYLQARARD
jgi:predicted esterase